jgi:hypothetical protein
MAQISHIPCPDKVHCKSSDAYSWNSTDCVGYCHACSETSVKSTFTPLVERKSVIFQRVLAHKVYSPTNCSV